MRFSMISKGRPLIESVHYWRGYGILQVRFSQKGSKSLPKFTSENLNNKWLQDGCLDGVHF